MSVSVKNIMSIFSSARIFFSSVSLVMSPLLMFHVAQINSLDCLFLDGFAVLLYEFNIGFFEIFGIGFSSGSPRLCVVLGLILIGSLSVSSLDCLICCWSGVFLVGLVLLLLTLVLS